MAAAEQDNPFIEFLNRYRTAPALFFPVLVQRDVSFGFNFVSG